MLKKLDLPPLWLLLFGALGWASGQYFHVDLSLSHPITDFLAAVLLGGGVILIALAVVEMRQKGAALHPHKTGDVLVTSGIFKRSRNPIYLGYLLILAGFLLCFDTILALPLVPIFLWLVENRFVIQEEKALRRKFRADFARYCQRTRRWV